ncbi:helix-turn-helix domain-containing protein [Sphingobacterium sp. MYb382]|uniref:helix-turn-helix domain-containing protein n=1 Tax=Sphingobacterium sp. MYb382 TaxID=2745278 RepID=UPI0030A428EA
MNKRFIIDQIRILRRKHNLSQSEMADKLHISMKTYQNIEYGITKIDLDRLEKIMELLNSNWKDFLETADLPIENNGDHTIVLEKVLEERNRYIEKLERDVLYYQKLLENRLY